jgi:uncharacterized protein (TIGR02569 family)
MMGAVTGEPDTGSPDARPLPQPPPEAVLAAFGARGTPVRLDGGQGRTWRCGDVVLKPSGFAEESNWRAEALHGIRKVPRSIRIARPVRPPGAAVGEWLVDGWEAWEAVAGSPDPRRLDEIRHAGSAFHGMFGRPRRPSFLDRRDDAWTFGERVAFGELPVPDGTEWTDPLRQLVAALRPVEEEAYPVHGDLLGNVLFADGLPPAVIDWAVYFRPPAWAEHVAVIDAVTWGHVPIDRITRPTSWHAVQSQLRALIYRMATNIRGGTERPGDYREVCAALLDQADRAIEPPAWFQERMRQPGVTGLWIDASKWPDQPHDPS